MEFGSRELVLIAIGFFVGGVGSYLWRKFKRQSDKPAPPEQSAPTPKPSTDNSLRFREAVDALIELNRSIRLDPAYAGTQVALIEAIIDDGLDVISLAHERLPYHELSWEVCRLLSHWLQKHTEGYAKLAESQRADNSARFEEGLVSMQKQLYDFRKLLESGIEMDFSAALATIKIKFS